MKTILITLLFIIAATSRSDGELIGEIVVRGAVYVPESVVLSMLRTEVGQVYQQTQLNRDRERLLDDGRFQDVKVYGQFLENNTWRVVIELIEWPLVNGIKLTGNTVYKNEQILPKLKTQPGKIFSLRDAVSDAELIREMYRTDGYFVVIDRFEPSMIDPREIELNLIETRVGDVQILGLTHTKQSVVQKLIDTKKGDLLHQPTWLDDLRRVFDTQWFESIEPDSREPDPGRVDLILNLKEARTGIANVGVQLDPRNRLAGFVTYSEANFRGSGKAVGVSLLQSAQGLGTSASLDYTDPFFDSRRTTLSVSLYTRESLMFGTTVFGGGDVLDTDRLSQRRTGIFVGTSRVLRKEDRITTGLRAEKVSTNNFNDTPEQQLLVQDGDILSIELGFIRSRRDTAVEPAKGDWLNVKLIPTYANITKVGNFPDANSVLGKNFYTKTSVDYRMYFSPGPKRVGEQLSEPRQVLAIRFYGGYINGKVPFFDQFFIGGSNGVRGYAEDRFWGRQALMTQIEYRYPIQKAFNLVAFVDYGGAWDGFGAIRDLTQSKKIDLHLGYGLGVNFRTPLGPIRLDVAFDDKGKVRSHFSIGTSF